MTIPEQTLDSYSKEMSTLLDIIGKKGEMVPDAPGRKKHEITFLSKNRARFSTGVLKKQSALEKAEKLIHKIDRINLENQSPSFEILRTKICTAIANNPLYLSKKDAETNKVFRSFLNPLESVSTDEKISLNPKITTAEEFLTLSDQIRSRSPSSTEHLEELAPMVENHILFAENALVKQSSKIKAVPSYLQRSKASAQHQKQQKLLANFKREAEQRVSNKNVSYEWWICFNFRISILLTPEENRSTVRAGRPNSNLSQIYSHDLWHSHNSLIASHDIKNYLKINSFPENILYPTIQGDLSLEELNLTATTNTFLIGMAEDQIVADGENMWPEQFFHHDLVHFSNFLHNENSMEKATKLHEIYTTHLDKLNEQERQSVVFWYFMVSHEIMYGMGSDPKWSIQTSEGSLQKGDRDYYSFFDPSWYRDILPNWIDKSNDSTILEGLKSSQIHFKNFIESCLKVEND